MDVKFVYMTASSHDEAETIGGILVEERLAACVNILGATTSIYRWEGQIAKESEVAFTAKTTGLNINALIARVQELHSYDCPCIIAIPVDNGASDFLNWIEEETR